MVSYRDYRQIRDYLDHVLGVEALDALNFDTSFSFFMGVFAFGTALFGS